MLDVSDARARILAEVSPADKEGPGIRPGGVEEVSLLSALGRILASPVTADLDLPPFRNSAVDGYAVRHEETAGAGPSAPVRFRVVGEIPAGGVPTGPLGTGEAVLIMTGAPVPEGATAVVMVEQTRRDGETVWVERALAREENIRQQGEDVRRGETVLEPGIRIRPQEIALLASLGWTRVPVRRRPKVAIVSTGDELVEVDEPVGPGQIRNSNSYSLAALVTQYGGEPIRLGIARDTWDDTEAKVRRAIEEGEIVLTSAGVSVGERDLVKNVFKALGIELAFWQVAMQPGRPLVFAAHRGKLIFGLPGNPVSSMVAFEEFVRPALLAMAGARDVGFLEVTARAAEPIRKKPGKLHFLRGICWEEEGSFRVRTTGPQGSGIQKSMVLANCIVVIPKDVAELAPGDPVTVQLLGHLPLSTPPAVLQGSPPPAQKL